MWRLISPCHLYTDTGVSRSWERRDFAGPYVTGVGGTISISTRSRSSIGSEISGGGFSNLFPTPLYQRTAVEEFFDTPGDQTKWAEAGYFMFVLSSGLTQIILTM